MKYANGIIYKGGQRSAFVCAKTYKRILELLEEFRISKSHFNDYWSKCGNDLMYSLAKDQEGVWIASDVNSRDYKKFALEQNKEKEKGE